MTFSNSYIFFNYSRFNFYCTVHFNHEIDLNYEYFQEVFSEANVRKRLYLT